MRKRTGLILLLSVCGVTLITALWFSVVFEFPPLSSQRRESLAAAVRAWRSPRKSTGGMADRLIMRSDGGRIIDGAVPVGAERELGLTEQAAPLDVTLVTIGSFDRLASVRETARAWGGPVSAAVLLAFDRASPKGGEQARAWQELAAEPGNVGRVVVRTFCEKEIPEVRMPWNGRERPDQVGRRAAKASGFPINFLRNRALDGVRTALALVADADMVPGAATYENLVRDQALLRETVLPGRTFLVLPSLQLPAANTRNTTTADGEFTGAVTVDEAREWVRTGRLVGFHSSDAPLAYGLDDVARWASGGGGEDSYGVEYRVSYEPYGVVRADVPRFQELFRGSGHDKASWSFALATLFGYSFKVYGRGYLVHRGHEGRAPVAAINDRLMWEIVDHRARQQACSEGVPRLFETDRTLTVMVVALGAADAADGGPLSVLFSSLRSNVKEDFIGSYWLVTRRRDAPLGRWARDVACLRRVGLDELLGHLGVPATGAASCAEGELASLAVSSFARFVTRTRHVLVLDARTVLVRPLRAADLRTSGGKESPAAAEIGNRCPWARVRPGLLFGPQRGDPMPGRIRPAVIDCHASRPYPGADLVRSRLAQGRPEVPAGGPCSLWAAPVPFEDRADDAYYETRPLEDRASSGPRFEFERQRAEIRWRSHLARLETEAAAGSGGERVPARRVLSSAGLASVWLTYDEWIYK